MTRRLRGKDLARAADEAAIAEARLFTVVRFRGRDAADGPVPRTALWDRREIRDADPATALERARELKARLGNDAQGRRPMIYAVTDSGASIFVE